MQSSPPNLVCLKTLRHFTIQSLGAAVPQPPPQSCRSMYPWYHTWHASCQSSGFSWVCSRWKNVLLFKWLQSLHVSPVLCKLSHVQHGMVPFSTACLGVRHHWKVMGRGGGFKPTPLYAWPFCCLCVALQHLLPIEDQREWRSEIRPGTDSALTPGVIPWPTWRCHDQARRRSQGRPRRPRACCSSRRSSRRCTGTPTRADGWTQGQSASGQWGHSVGEKTYIGLVWLVPFFFTILSCKKCGWINEWLIWRTTEGTKGGMIFLAMRSSQLIGEKKAWTLSSIYGNDIYGTLS